MLKGREIHRRSDMLRMGGGVDAEAGAIGMERTRERELLGRKVQRYNSVLRKMDEGIANSSPGENCTSRYFGVDGVLRNLSEL